MAIGRPDPPGSGLLLVDKPAGITSFGVVARLRKLTGIRRIGHAGTLDPFAEGLLPVAIGKATAIVRFMDDYDKVYSLTAEFGRTTDTLDSTGTTTSNHPLDRKERQALLDSDFAVLRQAVAGLVGELEQVPPMYSAVKIDGKPLYAYARQGREIERESRTIRVFAASLEGISLEDTLRAQVNIHCSKGTYIRCLADDLGRYLGFGAFAAKLRRLRCGPFRIEDALSLDRLQDLRDECADQASFVEMITRQGILRPAFSALAGMPVLELTPIQAIKLVQGQQVAIPTQALPQTDPNPAAASRLAIVSQNRLVGVGHLEPDGPDLYRLLTERVLIDLADLRQA